MQTFGVGLASVGEPEFFVETYGVDNQSVFLPMADRSAIVSANCIVRLPLGTAIGIDDPPVAVATSQKHQNAPQLLLFDELKSMRSLKLARSARWKTAGKGIVLEQAALAVLI